MAVLVRGDASAETKGIWAVASDGSGCLVPVAAAKATSADYVGSVR